MRLPFCLAHGHTDSVGRMIGRLREHFCMRYAWASIVAIAIIALGTLFVRQTRVAFEQQARERAAASGHPLPEGPAPNLQGMGFELSSSEIARVSIADLLAHFWYVFVMLVIVTCFGVAEFTGRRPSSAGPTSTPSEH
jgi:hypothetical protein